MLKKKKMINRNKIIKHALKMHMYLCQVDDYLNQHKIEPNQNENTDILTQRFRSKIDSWNLLVAEKNYSFSHNKYSESTIPNAELKQKLIKKMILEEIESYKKQNPHFYKELFLFYDKIKSRTTQARFKQEWAMEVEHYPNNINLCTRHQESNSQYNMVHHISVESYPNVYDVLDDVLKEKEKEFRSLLISLIREKEVKTNKHWYAYINISRQSFSKYISGEHPSRDTAIKLAFGLRLSIEETETFLNAAGYSLSFSCNRDIIIRFCIEHNINAFETDYILMEYNEKVLFG